jgi:hypothetical protein
MKQAIGACLFLVSLAFVIQARCTTLPDACGDDKVQFDVKTQKNSPAPEPPDARKARVVLIEVLDRNMACWSCGTPTSRFGLDGAWVGATQGNSYFTVDVAPGEHHLCTGWQSALPWLREKVGVAEFTAEAGKTYYFEVLVKLKEHNYGAGADGSSEVDRDLKFAQVSDDEGRYRLKASALATATPSK